MTGLRIAIATRAGVDWAERVRQVAPGAEVRIVENAAALDGQLAWPEVVFGNLAPEQFARAPRLRWVQLTSSGFEPYLGLPNSPVVLTTARGVTSKAGAEHVLAMMLSFTRQLRFFHERQRARVWERNIPIVGSLAGQTLGLIGCGANAQALAVRAQAMEMRVIAVKRTPAAAPVAGVDELWTVEHLPELLAEADHVAVLIPLTSATRGLLGKEQLQQMKRGAFLYNVSRGGVMDERALLEKLRAGSLGGAALDVFAEEPLPADSPFWDLPNVIITPHLGAAWGGMWEAAFALFCDNLRRFVAGAPLKNPAQLARGY